MTTANICDLHIKDIIDDYHDIDNLFKKLYDQTLRIINLTYPKPQ